MKQRCTFSAQFKSQVVLDLSRGTNTAAELCRQHQLNALFPSCWKTEFVERAVLIFEEQAATQKQQPIAELERLVGNVFTRYVRGWHLGRGLDQVLNLHALESS